MTVAGQETVNYSYDANSRLTNLQAGELNFGFAYDELGRRTALTYPNGITTSYSYDSANRPTGIDYLLGAHTLKSLSYGYDANGNRLSFSGHKTLMPEPMTATYNQGNQQVSSNGELLSYDANGNLVQKGDMTFQWDARNRLMGITSPDYNASFKYDALGRRIEKTVNGKTVNYLYDGWDIVQEIEDGMVATNYLRGLHIDETLGIFRGDSAYYYLTDALGSTIALTDPSGNIATEYYYDPFGNTHTSNPYIYNPIQYTGRENDGWGHYHYRARTKLDTRFISEDPIGLAGGINLFVYAGNSPVNKTDPLGLWYIDINVTLGTLGLAGTGGVIIDTVTGDVRLYGGGGLGTTGFSVTGSASAPNTGAAVGLQGTGGLSGQFGYSFGEGGGRFVEVGGGWPSGGALTGYYVFDPVANIYGDQLISTTQPVQPAICHSTRK